MKILHIYKDTEAGGYKNVCDRNSVLLADCIGERNVTDFVLPATNLINAALSLLRCGSYGVSKSDERKIISLITTQKFDVVFLEGSIYGSLIKKLRKLNVKTVCFLHNIDKIFFSQRYRNSKSFASWVQYRYVSYCEKVSMRYSSYLIALTERDKAEAKNIYNREANLVLPVTYKPSEIKEPNHDIEPYVLFVGSDFFANKEALSWYFDKIAPNLHCKTIVVGSCCKAFDHKSVPLNIELKGYVDDLARLYADACAVVAPILSGSGMKTKSIEALSFGKYIIGTPEAFVGIENINDSIGTVCTNEAEFISAINELSGNNRFNTPSMELFTQNFDTRRLIPNFSSFLTSISDENSSGNNTL